MSLELKGKITKVMPVQTGMGKKGAWHKMEFVIEMPGQYPKQVAMSLWGEDKINKYDLEVGLEVTASIEIESRENSGRWYTEIRSWKIQWTEQARKWQPGN